MIRNIILRIHLSRLTKRPPVGGFVIVLDLVKRNNRVVELLLQCNVVWYRDASIRRTSM